MPKILLLDRVLHCNYFLEALKTELLLHIKGPVMIFSFTTTAQIPVCLGKLMNKEQENKLMNGRNCMVDIGRTLSNGMPRGTKERKKDIPYYRKLAPWKLTRIYKTHTNFGCVKFMLC